MARFANLNTFDVVQTNVTTSGTPVQVASNAVPPGVLVVVKAKAANTGTITVGNSSANALNTGTTSFRLAQNQSVALEIQNTNAIWLDATVSGEGVEIIFER